MCKMGGCRQHWFSFSRKNVRQHFSVFTGSIWYVRQVKHGPLGSDLSQRSLNGLRHGSRWLNRHEGRTILSSVCASLTASWLKSSSWEHSPPPFLPHRYGNLQTFPRPMAYPTHDNKKSNFPFQLPLSGIASVFLSSAEGATGSSSSKGTACLTSVGEFKSTVLCPVFPMVGQIQTSGVRKSSVCVPVWLRLSHCLVLDLTDLGQSADPEYAEKLKTEGKEKRRGVTTVLCLPAL